MPKNKVLRSQPAGFREVVSCCRGSVDVNEVAKRRFAVPVTRRCLAGLNGLYTETLAAGATFRAFPRLEGTMFTPRPDVCQPAHLGGVGST